MGRQEIIVKAAHQRHLPVQDPVVINTWQFLLHRVFGDTVVVIKPRLGPPAYMYGGGHMCLAPLHHHGQLRPVIHFLVLQVLHRSPGYNHPVKLFLLYIIECNIKFVEMAGWRVFWYMGGQHQEGTVHLEGCIGQCPHKLGLCFFLERHQIQNQDFQRTYILAHGPVLIHNEYVFFLQNRFCWQISLYFYRHVRSLLSNVGWIPHGNRTASAKAGRYCATTFAGTPPPRLWEPLIPLPFYSWTNWTLHRY